MNRIFFKNLVPGTLLFGQFELVRCLSAGDLGGVYLCKRRDDGNEYALKIFSTDALKESRLAENFERELRLSFSVQHPNVIRCYDIFADDCFTAFSMEYVEGGTLQDLIQKSEGFSVEELVDVLSQLASGLAAIHAAGIVHRDLKPENVLVTKDRQLKITDFGIAATNGGMETSPCDELAGTVNYLSPEYIANGSFDERSDIYAFGVIAYELLTGREPFSGNGLIDTLVSRVRFDPTPPRELRPDLPRSLSELALRSMNRYPERRYQRVMDVTSHLQLIRTVEGSVFDGRVRRPSTSLSGLANSRPAARIAA